MGPPSNGGAPPRDAPVAALTLGHHMHTHSGGQLADAWGCCCCQHMAIGFNVIVSLSTCPDSIRRWSVSMTTFGFGFLVATRSDAAAVSMMVRPV